MFQPINPADNRAKPKTVVLLPLPGIGDMIWHVPVLAALAANDSSGRIDLIAHENVPVGALLGREKIVGSAMTLPTGRRMGQRLAALSLLTRGLRAGAYKRIVILHHSWRYALGAWLAGIPEIRGYGFGPQRYFLTQTDCLPPADRKLYPPRRAEKLLDLIGLSGHRKQPKLTRDPHAMRDMARAYATHPMPWAGFGIGAREPVRCWPPERFAAVADALWQAGWRSIFLLGSAGDAERAEAIAHACRTAKPISVTNRPLDHTMAIIAQCAFMLSNDSGLMNIAAVLDVPSYVIASTLVSPACFATVRQGEFSPHLRPIVPEGGIDPKTGASKITVERALAKLCEDGILETRLTPES